MRRSTALRLALIGTLAIAVWLAPAFFSPSAEATAGAPSPMALAPASTAGQTAPDFVGGVPSADASASSASAPVPVAPAPVSPATLGANGPITLADLPPGPFLDSLLALPAGERPAVLARLARLGVGPAQLATLRAAREGLIYPVCPPGPHAHPHGLPDPVDDLAGATAAGGTFASDPLNATAFAAPVPIANPPALSSRPGSTNVLYLDFNGHTVTGTAWNEGFDAFATYVALPYDIDGDPATFSDAEQAIIRNVWERVAEDFRAFDLNVTTVEPATFTPTTGRALITLARDANDRYVPGGANSGGVAYLAVFGEADYVSRHSPAWIIADNVDETNAANIAEVCSHEFGHNLALAHDGRVASGSSPREEYYLGHGQGPTSWGPIMGASYGRNVTTFSKGEYARANNIAGSGGQDDLDLIASYLGYRADDVPDNNLGAPVLASGLTSGVIEKSTDADRYKFTTGGGNVLISITPYFSATGTRGNNLDILADILTEGGAVVATSNPDATGDALFDFTTTPGAYYLRIRPTGVGNPAATPSSGYTVYGSIGGYTIENNTSALPPPVITTQPVGAARPRGTGHTFTIAADETTTSYQWFFNGAAIAGARESSLTIDSLAFSHAGTYRCAVANSAGTRQSTSVALAVYRDTAQTYSINPGSDANLPTLVAGALDDYRWSRDGELLSATQDGRIRPVGPSLRINDIVASDAAVYTLAAKFEGEALPIGPVTVLVRPPVILSVPATVTTLRGDDPVVPITSTHDNLTYTYIGRPGGLGFNSATGALTSGTPGPAPGTYQLTLVGTDPFNNKGRTSFTLIIQPREVSLSLPPVVSLYRGVDFSPPITTDGVGVTYRYSGLPAGLTYSSVTGALLTGRAPPAAGSYEITLTVTDAYNNVATTTFTLEIGAAPPERLGTHLGLLARDPLLNQNLGATFTFTPAATGLVTGRLRLGKVTYALTGRLRGGPGEDFRLALTGSARGRAPLTLQFTLPADGSGGTGQLIPAASAPVALQVWPAPYSKKNPATAYAGKGTFGLFTENATPAPPTTPAGVGFGAWSVATTGKATWKGRLADGTIVTGASALARTGEIPVLRPVPKVGGSLHGVLAVSPGSRAIDGDLSWTRGGIASTAKTYPKTVLYRDGFGPLAVTALGGPYARPAAGVRVLGLTEAEPRLRLEFIGAGLSDPVLAQLAQPELVVTANNAVVKPLAATNPAGLVLKLNAATGAFSGSFLLRDPNPLAPARTVTRKIGFQGTLIDGRGVGYFLVPGLRTSTADAPPTLSGAVLIETAADTE